jgi:hypothetical protein
MSNEEATTYADKCENCDKATLGLSGSTKWCAYCGGKLTGETVLVKKYVKTELSTLLAESVAREAALREELATTKGELDSLLVRYSNMWDAHDKCAERLTAAEQRNAECIALLRRSTAGDGQDLKTWWNDRALILQTELTKPTKSGVSE